MFRNQIVATAFCLLLSAPAFAQVELTGWVSRIETTGDDTLLDTPVGRVRFEIASGPGFGASAGYRGGGRLGWEVGFMSLEPEATVSAGGFSLDVGEIDMQLASAMVQIHLLPDSVIDPYAGVGAAWVRFGEIRGTVLDLLDADDAELDDQYGYLLNGGAVVRLSPRAAIVIDARYVPVEMEISGLPGEIEINPLIVSAGFRYRLR
jgi:outer membrane protein W